MKDNNKKMKLKNLLGNEKGNIDDIYKHVYQDIDKEFSSDMLKGKNPKVKKVSDDDMLLSMTKRLTMVEKQLSESTKLIIEKDKEIAELKSSMQKIKSETEQSSCANCKKLKSHIEDLEKYIADISDFLKDNGFIILNQQPVLDSTTKEKEASIAHIENEIARISQELNTEEEFPVSDDNNTHIPKEIDITVLARRIEELNMLIYKDGSAANFESEDGRVFKMKHRKELPIYFYKNGLIIEDYLFYKYSTTEAKKILQDILDGYTPYILKNKFPDGVLLKLVNYVYKDYVENDCNNAYQKLDQPPVRKKKITGEEFLKIFPDKVIKDGKIFNIKDDMEKFLVVKRDNESNVEKEDYYLFDKTREKEYENVTAKLKIKILALDRIITLFALKTECISVILEYIQTVVNKSQKNITINKIEDYCLISSYPMKVHKFDTIGTLEQNGLFPSHFLIFDEYSKYIK